MTRDDWRDRDFAAAWDEADNRRTNPDRDNQVGLLADLVAQSAPSHLLDLGIGSARVEAAIERRHPGFFNVCKVTGVDYSDPMLALARQREIAGTTNTFSLVQADFSDIEDLKPDVMPDTVICVQALHEVTDDIKQRIFQRVHELLPSGRPFYILDRFTYSDGAWMDDWRATWRWMSQKLEDDVLDFEDYHVQYRDKTDHVTSMERYLDWLQTAGFSTICPYRSFNRALIVARA